MKKALLINRGGGRNLGDQLICRSLELQLREAGYEVQVADLLLAKEGEDSQKSGRTSRLVSNVRRQASRVLPPQVRLLSRILFWRSNAFDPTTDIVLIGGGQLLLSNALFPWAVFYWSSLLRASGLRNIALFGVGAGTRFTTTHRLLLDRALRNVDHIYVRDDASRDVVLNTWGRRATVMPDVAFALAPSSIPIEDRAKLALVGIVEYESVKRYGTSKLSRDDYHDHYAEVIRGYLAQGFDVRLFYTTPSDRDESLGLQRRLEKVHQIAVPLAPTDSLDELLRLVSSAREVYSGRMHALIAAVLCGCRAQAFLRNEKLIHFSEQYLEQSQNLPVVREAARGALRELLATSPP